MAPVDGPIIARYEEPPGPYAKGHRGIDYGVSAGTPVKASNAGTVIFAGPVADDGLFVTIRHSDGLETLYSFLSRIDVGSGAGVAKGQVIGLTGGGHPGKGADALHFAMKQNGRYIDPEPVLRGDYDDISRALALVPVEPDPDQAEPQENAYGSQGTYFGSPSRAGPNFSTNQGAGRSGATGPYRGRGGSSEGLQGSRSGSRTAPIPYWSSDGLSGSGSEADASWERKRDRIGRFLAGEEESRKLSRESARKAGAGHKRAERQKTSRRPSQRTGWTALSPSRAIWGPASAFVGRTAGAVRDWTVRQMDKVASFMISRWERIKLWLARQADRIGNFIRPRDGAGWEAFIPGLTSGLFRQIGCSLRGGDTPPTMPTAQQFRSGEMKPPPAPNDNIVMVIGGLGSSSTEKNGRVRGHASLFDVDFRTLGFKEEQIYHYSYKGVEKKGGTGPYRIHAPYMKGDTYKEIEASARLLDEQVQEIHRQNPRRKIDLVAHSEGGLVANYYVSRIYDRSNPKHPGVDHFLTLNSPHQGADAARLGRLFSETATGHGARAPAEKILGRLAGAPPAGVPVVQQLEEDSRFIRQLKRSYEPKKVKTTTIGTSWDWVVTAPHTSIPATKHYTTDLEGLTLRNVVKAHSEAATAKATKGFFYNALADRSSQCTAFRNAFAQHVSGAMLATTQDLTIQSARTQFHVTDWWGTLGGNTRLGGPPVTTK